VGQQGRDTTTTQENRTSFIVGSITGFQVGQRNLSEREGEEGESTWGKRRTIREGGRGSLKMEKVFAKIIRYLNMQ